MSSASPEAVQTPGLSPGLALVMDVFVVLFGVWLVGAVLGWQFLLSPNLPTGGDSASHLLYLWVYAQELIPSGRITAWMPEVFGGFAFLSYYFPLAFIAIVGLMKLMAQASAIKVGMFAAAMLMPGGMWLASTRWLKLPRWIAVWGVLACLAFLFHEQNSIWGGNLLSTLAGEFTQSYGVFFCLLTLLAWQRCIASGRGWFWVVALEAATGFANGFALLVTGFATGAFLFDRQRLGPHLRLLLTGHGLAFFMLAGWLWPMLEMHGITIPNDALFEVSSWKELLPFPHAVLLCAGLAGALGHGVIQLVPRWRHAMPWGQELKTCSRQVYFMACVALLAGVGFLAGSILGLANIRFFPFVWLFGGVACAWTWGSLLWRLGRGLSAHWRWGWPLITIGCGMALLTSMALNMNLVMDWALWNHSGLEPKPQWQQLTRVFPALQGSLQSPRLLFEHDPANNDIGSTRTLEALPMFLHGRPVLEGLYMESALLAPAVYQLQSEVSRYPSSPLARFPSASMNLDQAARHMRFLWSNEVLVRHPETVAAFKAHAAFQEIASAEPFHVFRLRSFETHMVDVVQQPLRWLSRSNWMEKSFAWFKNKQAMDDYLPVFDDGSPPNIQAAPAVAKIDDFQLTRESISWRTNAVGSAHLLRVSWHPKWHLASKGQIFLAGPGFMLVVPQEQQVTLEYKDTSVGLWGQRASLLAFLLWGLGLAWRWRRRLKVSPEQPVQGHPNYWPSQGLILRGGSWLWPLLLGLLALMLHIKNPERLYTHAWDLYRHGELAKAADGFDQAYHARSSAAKKEEALFWAGKTYELANDRTRALQRYKSLVDNYTGYWLPEALFTLAHLAEQAGDQELADVSRRRLLNDFPTDAWAQKLKPLKPLKP